MVRLRLAGGSLSEIPRRLIQAQLDEAARAYAEGRLGEAASHYHQILSQSPHEAEAFHMLGAIALQANKPELALRLIDAALTADPNLIRARFNRCVALRALARDDEALQSARTALEADPTLAEAWEILGQIQKSRCLYAEADQSYTRALHLQPDNPRFYANYALLRLAQGDNVAAYRACRMAESLTPYDPPMLLGHILKGWGYPDLAADCFARIRAFHPTLSDAALNEAIARLQTGDFTRGWPLWEQRPDLDASLAALPLWRGETTTDLLLYEDQGLGDAINFARYIPQAAALAQHLTLRLPASLHRLFAASFPDITLLTAEAPLPAATARCRLSSLPALFAPSLPTAPYLAAPKADTNAARTFLRALPTLQAPRIGLVWAGNANFHNDHARSLDFNSLSAALAPAAAHIISLQKDRDADRSLIAAANIIDAAPRLLNFADTAAVIGELDLVISVDTAVAHLAGAMGKPVYLLLPFDADWRWLMAREDSIWYPTARLFRQHQPADWSQALTALASAVHAFLSGNKTAHLPTQDASKFTPQNPLALPLPA